MQAVARLPRRVAFALTAALGRRRYRRGRGFVGTDAQTILRDRVGVAAEDIETVTKEAYECAACDELEYVLLRRIQRKNLGNYLELRGLDRLASVLEHNRGAILYSAHVRGHYLFFAALGLLGFTPNVVGMPIDPRGPLHKRQAYERRDAVLREKMGCRFLYMQEDFGVGVRASKALLRNEVVTFEIDHSHSAQNIRVPFLGRVATFPLGPLLVARSTGTSLLPFWLHRPPKRTPQVAHIGEPVAVTDDLEGSLRSMLEPLEENIRLHPESWATWLFPDFRLWATD